MTTTRSRAVAKATGRAVKGQPKSTKKKSPRRLPRVPKNVVEQWERRFIIFTCETKPDKPVTWNLFEMYDKLVQARSLTSRKDQNRPDLTPDVVRDYLPFYSVRTLFVS